MERFALYVAVRQYLVDGKLDVALKEKVTRIAANFTISESKLFYTGPSASFMRLVVLSEEQRRRVLEECHNNPCTGNHRGMRATLDRVVAGYYWASIKADVADWVKSCHRCQMNDSIKTVSPALHPIKIDVFKKGSFPEVSRCARCCDQYHCPFCERYKTKSKQSIDNHVKNHIQLAIHHDDFVIVKCNFPCRENAHFHCCYCSATVIRKVQFITHLKKCKQKLGISGQEPQSQLLHSPAATAPSPVITQVPPLSCPAATAPLPVISGQTSPVITQVPPLSCTMSIHTSSTPVMSVFQSPPSTQSWTNPLCQPLQPDPCVACSCKNRCTTQTKSRGITFHKFPKEKVLRKQCEISRRRKVFSASKSSVLCSEHFRPQDLDRTGQSVRVGDGVKPSVIPAHLQKPVKTRNTQTSRKAEQSLSVDRETRQIQETKPLPNTDHSYALPADITGLKARLTDALARVESLERHMRNMRKREQSVKNTLLAVLKDLEEKNPVNKELRDKFKFYLEYVNC